MQRAQQPLEGLTYSRGGGGSGYTSGLFAGDISVNRWQSLSLSHTALSRIAEEPSWLLQPPLCPFSEKYRREGEEGRPARDTGRRICQCGKAVYSVVLKAIPSPPHSEYA